MAGQQLINEIKDGYVDNKGVRIHYVTKGEGPLVVMLHGFPEFWYSWRNQIPALAEHYKAVAVDLRGYNLSDKPKGVEKYAMPELVSDIAAVIQDLGEERAIIMGHDWGGAISWAFATHLPHMVEKLIICNLPHPRALNRELVNNPEQQKNSEYARNFQQPGYHKNLSAEGLAEWITDLEAHKHYIEALNRSDFEAMLNYYKANYPREPYIEMASPVKKVQCPVLMIHGLDDSALLPGALNDSWRFVEQDLTLVTIPGAGHFVQQDAANLVTQSIMMWLQR